MPRASSRSLDSSFAFDAPENSLAPRGALDIRTLADAERAITAGLR